jgi:preprotein translocase subunit SecD
MIELAFNMAGAQAWYLMTERNVNKPVAIIANNVVLTAPVVESAIEGGPKQDNRKFFC